jgi:hypothetical protein
MTLPLQAISAAAEGVFQRRLVGKDPIKHAMMVAELKRSLETTGEPFRVPNCGTHCRTSYKTTTRRGCRVWLPRWDRKSSRSARPIPIKQGFLTLLRRDQKPPASGDVQAARGRRFISR